jgi:uncharacterized membrane protein YeaQ/YmgE (transglycosylase-associated protein family)
LFKNLFRRLKVDIVGLLVWIIVGAIAGWLASIVMKTNRSQGLLTDIIVGIIGGFIGGLVLNLLNVNTAAGSSGVSGFNLASILTAFIGAVILLGILRVVRR